MEIPRSITEIPEQQLRDELKRRDVIRFEQEVEARDIHAQFTLRHIHEILELVPAHNVGGQPCTDLKRRADPGRCTRCDLLSYRDGNYADTDWVMELSFTKKPLPEHP